MRATLPSRSPTTVLSWARRHPDGRHRRRLRARSRPARPRRPWDAPARRGLASPGVTGTPTCPTTLERPASSAAPRPCAVRAGARAWSTPRPPTVERLAADPGLAAATVAVVAASRSLTRTDRGRPRRRSDVLVRPRPPRPPVDDVDRRGAAGVAQPRVPPHRGPRPPRAATSSSGRRPRSPRSAARSSTRLRAGGRRRPRRQRRRRPRRDRHGQARRRRAQLRERRRRAVRGRGRRDAASSAGPGRSWRSAGGASGSTPTSGPRAATGPLVRSLDCYEAYWDRWAEPWEFQALLKARPVGRRRRRSARRWLDAAQRWLWADAVHRRRPALAAGDEGPGRGRGRPQGPHRPRAEAGPGRHPRHRVRGAAAAARARPRSTPSCARPPRSSPSPSWPRPATSTATTPTRLADAYRFLRTVEHRLQLVDEQQIHTLPDRRRSPLDRLARVLGLPRHRRGRRAAEQLDSDLRPTQATRALDPRAALLPPAARGVRRRRAGAPQPEAAAEPASPRSASPTPSAPGPRCAS